jgi:exosortase D (VPLPA-CTERM-specific)
MSHSVEVAPLPPPTESRKPSKPPNWRGGALLLLILLIAWLYFSILWRLVLEWVGPHNDPNFEHGIFVPLFALFVLWLNRKKLKAIPPASSWAGPPLVALSMVMLVLGVLGAELFFSRTSLLVLLAGLILTFRGWRFFRAVFFPLAVLILMIPIPKLIINEITFPLQLLASRLSTDLLELVGVPVLRQGNIIYLAAMPLNITDACSGIRSLLSLVTLAVIYGYLLDTRSWVRVALVGFAVPIAVAANVFRIFGTGLLVQSGHKDQAEGFYHALGGVLIFAVALIMLFVVHNIITRIWGSGSAVRDRINLERGLDRARPGIDIGDGSWSFRFAIVAAVLLVTAIGLKVHKHNEILPGRELLSSLPLQIGGWIGGADETLDEETLNVLGHPTEYLLRSYANPAEPRPIDVYLVYYASQRAGDTIHSPAHCLPGAGWISTSREVVRVTRPDGSSFAANRYVGSLPGQDPQLALFWFQAHGRGLASAYQAKEYLITDAIRMNRSDGALVRLMTDMLPGESADAAQARVMKLGSQLLPMLDRYIPR